MSSPSMVICRRPKLAVLLLIGLVALLLFANQPSARADANYSLGMYEMASSGNYWKGINGDSHVPSNRSTYGNLKLNGFYLETLGVGYLEYVETGWEWYAQYSNPNIYTAYDNSQTNGNQVYNTYGDISSGSNGYWEVNVYQRVAGPPAYWEWRTACNGTLLNKPHMDYGTGYVSAWEERWDQSHDDPYSHFYSMGKKDPNGSWYSWRNSAQASASNPGSYNGSQVYLNKIANNEWYVTY